MPGEGDAAVWEMIQAFEMYVGDEKYTDRGIECSFLNWIEILPIDTENLRAINQLKTKCKSHSSPW